MLIRWMRERRAVREARAQYEMARLQSMIENNRRRMAEIERSRVCPWCTA